MLRSPSAESLIRQVLLDATGPALDRVLFSTAAAVPNERPAGLLHNVTPITGTAGGGLNALVGDLKAMAVALAAVAGNSQVVLVAAAEQAVSLALLPPGGSPYIPLRR
jgi:hypothetical protein